MNYQCRVLYKFENRGPVEVGYLTGHCETKYIGLVEAWRRLSVFARQASSYAIVKVDITVPYMEGRR
jgi:hypothetical protein